MRFLHTLSARARAAIQFIRTKSAVLWSWYQGRKRWQQVAIAALLIVALIALAVFTGGKKEAAESALRTVTIASVGSLSGTGDAVSVIGTVRSVSEAEMLAQSGGTVRSVRAKIGQSVPAGYVIAELENASERAAVLSAQGSYEAALAARSITILQAGNTADSLVEAEVNARNKYRSAYTTVDTVIETYVDLFFSGSAYNPNLVINSGFEGSLERTRLALKNEMDTWRYRLEEADTTDSETLLQQAQGTTERLSAFLTELAREANKGGSGATSAQLTALATARTSIDTLLTTLSSTREAYRSARTAADVADRQTTTTDARTASADASVKQALGALRAAQANLERTIVRAPIAGTVNFLPIKVGDYVTNLMHVATVANNGSLEITTYISEDDRAYIAVGDKVTVENEFSGVITTIAPALDPTTKQIEVRIAVEGGKGLTNGQSVRIAFPNAIRQDVQIAGPVMLPLAAVKLRAEDRVIFTVNAEGTLVAQQVEIGAVRGDKIEVLTSIPPELMIVTDARGLAEGQKVTVAQ